MTNDHEGVAREICRDLETGIPECHQIRFSEKEIKNIVAILADHYGPDSAVKKIALYKDENINYREEVEYLKGQIKKLLAVIEPFAKVGDPECWDFRNSCFHRDSNKVLFGIGSREQTTKQAKVTFGDFRRAWECYQAAAEIHKEVTGE